MAAASIPPVSPTPEAVAAPMSEGARIINTFIAPSKTFTDLRNASSWSWIVPWLLVSVASVLFFVAVGQKIGFRKAVDNQVQSSPKATEQLDRLSPGDREHALERQAKGVQFFFTYLLPVFILFINLIMAVLLYGTFTFGAGANVSFKVVFAIVMYAALPAILKYLLAIVSLFAGTDPDSFNLKNPVATNPGYFLNSANSPFLFSLASSLDLFLIWSLVLTAVGFTCVSKVKPPTAFGIVFGWWILFSLGGAALAAAFS
jgi:hypothetical protein